MSADRGPFPGQFLIGDQPAELPSGFREIGRSGRVALAVDERLRAIPVHTVDGTLRGRVLGMPIDFEQGQLLSLELTLDLSAESTAAEIAGALSNRLAGSYLLVLTAEDGWLVVPDACATMGVVFDTRQGLAGSSAELVLGEDYERRLRPDLVRTFGVARDGWFTAGLTAHAGLERLLPNHALHLPSGRFERFGPRPLPTYVTASDDAINAIAAEIANVTGAILSIRPAAQTLTGGNETRAMLAANRPHAQSLEFVTLAVPGAERDVAIARRLAAQFDLSHAVLAAVRATKEQAEQWSKQAGHAMAGMNRVWHPSVAPLEGEVLIGGLGGEVGRGFLWSRALAGDAEITPEFLLTRLKLPRHPSLLERLSNWLAGLPHGLDAFQILDLAYVELRMGPWAFGQGYPRRGPRDLHPMISHKQFARMWSLPPEFRRDNGMVRAIVERCWPELADVPVNRYGDMRDLSHAARTVLRRPDRALSRLFHR